MNLTAKPPIKVPSLFNLKSDRFDKIYLYSSVEDKHWRYELTVVDRIISGNTESKVANPCAVFLIPAGRETEYLYSSHRGLLNISESANCARLIAVAFQRVDCLICNGNDPYQSQQNVQEELTAIVQLIAQHDGTRKENENFRIPFMVVDGIGQRNVIARGETSTTGPYIVEEVLVSEDQHFVRRLYFMRNPNVIQTEVYMNKEDSRQINRLKLAFEYHLDIISGFLLLGKTPSPPFTKKEQALVIGLGGGGLLNFINAFFKAHVYITAVELDPGVVEIAKEHFGLLESENSVKVIIGDGLNICPASSHSRTSLEEEDQILTTSSEIMVSPSSMSFIVIDVDSKDTSIGMSCPPISFISTLYLQNLKALLISDGGMLIINVSARDPNMLKLVQRNVCQVFSSQSIFIACENDNDDFEEVSSDALNVVIFAVLNEDNPFVLLPKGMDAVDKIYDAFDLYKVLDFELRGAMELSVAKVKRIQSVSKDDEPCVKAKSKTMVKKKTKGKKGKKR
jgi:hypothetical protein